MKLGGLYLSFCPFLHLRLAQGKVMPLYANMSRKLKIGVVGGGVFGGYHAAKCAAHPRVDYVGTFDKNMTRAEAIALPKGGAAFGRYSQLLKSCDAVIIASPASHHGEGALRALQSGCHALVEKPIATQQDLALKSIQAAAQRGLVLQVGHQERFVCKAIGLDKTPQTPLRIEAVRHSPYGPRGTDVSVTLDLMIHDLDMAFWLMKQDATAIAGETARVRSHTSDAALALISFPNGSVRLQASRVETASERIMRIVYPIGDIEIDFNAKTLRQSKGVLAAGFDLNENFGQTALASDSLGAGLDSFVASIVDGAEVAISGHDGLLALKAALIIDGH